MGTASLVFISLCCGLFSHTFAWSINNGLPKDSEHILVGNNTRWSYKPQGDPAGWLEDNSNMRSLPSQKPRGSEPAVRLRVNPNTNFPLTHLNLAEPTNKGILYNKPGSDPATWGSNPGLCRSDRKGGYGISVTSHVQLPQGVQLHIVKVPNPCPGQQVGLRVTVCDMEGADVQVVDLQTALVARLGSPAGRPALLTTDVHCHQYPH